MSQTLNVTVLGLGAMGSRMAQRLLEAGHRVTVFNRSAGAAEHLTRQGAEVAESPREAARVSSVVISMVTDDDAARAVWLDAQTGALDGLRPGARPEP